MSLLLNVTMPCSGITCTAPEATENVFIVANLTYLCV